MTQCLVRPAALAITWLALVGCREDAEPPTGLGAEPALASAAVSYVAVDLGALPGQPAGGTASDVNDSRQVAGTEPWTLHSGA